MIRPANTPGHGTYGATYSITAYASARKIAAIRRIGRSDRLEHRKLKPDGTPGNEWFALDAADVGGVAREWSDLGWRGPHGEGVDGGGAGMEISGPAIVVEAAS